MERLLSGTFAMEFLWMYFKISKSFFSGRVPVWLLSLRLCRRDAQSPLLKVHRSCAVNIQNYFVKSPSGAYVVN